MDGHHCLVTLVHTCTSWKRQKSILSISEKEWKAEDGWEIKDNTKKRRVHKQKGQTKSESIRGETEDTERNRVDAVVNMLNDVCIRNCKR